VGRLAVSSFSLKIPSAFSSVIGGLRDILRWILSAFFFFFFHDKAIYASFSLASPPSSYYFLVGGAYRRADCLAPLEAAVDLL